MTQALSQWRMPRRSGLVGAVVALSRLKVNMPITLRVTRTRRRTRGAFRCTTINWVLLQ